MTRIKQQAKLNVVREVFSSRKFPSMIAALKQAIAIYSDDPEWGKVRAPLVELAPEQAETAQRNSERSDSRCRGLGRTGASDR